MICIAAITIAAITTAKTAVSVMNATAAVSFHDQYRNATSDE
jgi:hypothetical protein